MAIIAMREAYRESPQAKVDRADDAGSIGSDKHSLGPIKSRSEPYARLISISYDLLPRCRAELADSSSGRPLPRFQGRHTRQFTLLQC